jgi:hypothetical protein
VIALVNAPVPVPSVVFELLVVGFAVVLQHTPRAVTVELPALVTLPPLVAVVAVTDVAEVLVTVGAVPPPPLPLPPVTQFIFQSPDIVRP